MERKSGAAMLYCRGYGMWRAEDAVVRLGLELETRVEEYTVGGMVWRR